MKLPGAFGLNPGGFFGRTWETGGRGVGCELFGRDRVLRRWVPPAGNIFSKKMNGLRAAPWGSGALCGYSPWAALTSFSAASTPVRMPSTPASSMIIGGQKARAS